MNVTPWSVLTVAVLIALVKIVTGHWNQHVFLALVALILLGALLPPLGLGIGLVALLYSFVVGDAGKVFSSSLEGSWGAVSGAMASPPPPSQPKQ